MDPNIQMEGSAYTVDPRDALETEALLAQWVNSKSGDAVLDSLLEDIRLGNLDE